jgi:hypothetical protein
VASYLPRAWWFVLGNRFDPFDGGRRFAVRTAGAFMTTDGVNWQRLLDTGAMRGLPTNCFFDQWSSPSDPSLYVGFAGRGVVKISDLGLGGGVILSTAALATEVELGPIERKTSRVRLADGRLGTAEAGPDERVLVTLDDGEFVTVGVDEATEVDPVSG